MCQASLMRRSTQTRKLRGLSLNYSTMPAGCGRERTEAKQSANDFVAVFVAAGLKEVGAGTHYA
jgi:hypothetical protein